MYISDSVKYIGVDDKDLDLFEGQYIIPEGISYNSYLILDEKVAVMDTVDERRTDEFLANLKAALDGRKPDYLVIHHMEPDHASSICAFLEEYPDTTLVGNAKIFQMLKLYYEDLEVPNQILMKEGDTLDLGKQKLTFYMAPMVHWPEVMVSYLDGDKLLFSADAFGKFGALDTEDDDWDCEARRYYFNIVGKYGPQVQALLKKTASLDLKGICPLHGPVLTDLVPHVLSQYQIWSSYGTETEGVFIAYCSMHGNTEKAALLLKEFLEEKGCPKVAIADLARTDMAEDLEDAFRYGRIILAAPSYNAGVAAFMEDFLNHLKAKNYQNRKIGLLENGSWAPSAAKTMRAVAETFKNTEIVEPVVTIRGAVKRDDIQNLMALADAILA